MEVDEISESEGAWAAWNREADAVLDMAHDRLRDTFDGPLFARALRFALDAENASQRCPRRGCRLAKACSLRHQAGKVPECRAGVSDETLERAVQLAIFAHMEWFDRFWAEIER